MHTWSDLGEPKILAARDSNLGVSTTQSDGGDVVF